MVRDLKGEYAAMLLANHGPVVAAKDLETVPRREHQSCLSTQAQVDDINAVISEMTGDRSWPSTNLVEISVIDVHSTDLCVAEPCSFHGS
jgi:hypothetical protein